MLLVRMKVYIWVSTPIFLLFQGAVKVKPTENTPHLLSLGKPNFMGTGSVF
ncbi:hypothetical protein MXB_3265 [Myxobolus squamalis]|nr:hypothetical protein MXB_3265 [Myxobolus squamalis]